MWNYRIVQKTLEDGEVEQGIHEVFYDEYGNLSYCTTNPVRLCWQLGENFIHIRKQLMMAFEQPVLYYEDFEQSDKEPF